MNFNLIDVVSNDGDVSFSVDTMLQVEQTQDILNQNFTTTN